MGGADMELRIDGAITTPRAGESLLHMIRRAGLEGDSLAARPLAAKIAG